MPITRARAVLLLCGLLLPHSIVVAARPMRFERFALDQGLSQQNVMVIAQDPVGFLWLGTEDGLNRYDGYTFEHVRHDRGDGGSLPDNYISGIVVDREGRLWAGTDAGIAWRDPVTGRFAHVVTAEAVGRVRVIYLDRAQHLWIGTRDS